MLFWLILLASGTLASAETLFIRNVTAVDATGSRPGVHVVVSNGRILSAGRSATPPKGARVIDGTGKFLLPGFWDMHVHLWEDQPQPHRYVAAGVTAVRDMGSDFTRTKGLKTDIDSGKRVGPRIWTAGPMVDAAGRGTLALRASTPEEARNAVDAVERCPADFVQVMSGLSADAYFSLAQRARVVRMPFAGHVPDGVSMTEAIDARQRSVEHLSGVAIACSPLETSLRTSWNEAVAKQDVEAQRTIRKRIRETWSPGAANVLFHRMARLGMYQTPTLTMLRRRWAAAQEEEEYRFAGQVVKFMAGSGVGVLAGTDAGERDVIPGVSLHDELEAMVEAGLSPRDALSTATINPARYFGLEASHGTVERGKAADLVLLDADPLADIRNTRRISAVILKGRLLDRKCLDGLSGGTASTCPSLSTAPKPARSSAARAASSRKRASRTR